MASGGVNMPRRRYFKLTEEEKAELISIRDSHEKPYMREKASALLKIAEGESPHAVALALCAYNGWYNMSNEFSVEFQYN